VSIYLLDKCSENPEPVNIEREVQDAGMGKDASDQTPDFSSANHCRFE
jgi:hypothetical protein